MSDFPKLGEPIPLGVVTSTAVMPPPSHDANELATPEVEPTDMGDPLQFWMLAPFKAGLIFSLAGTAMI
jgi:hypothetical protein